MNKKGFTLVEILGVIVILGTIMLIAIPEVMDTVRKAELKTLLISAREYVKSTNDKLYILETNGDSAIIADGSYTLNDLANQEVTVTITGEAPEGNSCVYVKNNEVIDYVLKYGNNIVTINEEKNPEFFDGAFIADCNDTGKRQVLITYSIDSSAVATAPDGNLYDVKAITCSSEVGQTWDTKTWELKHNDVYSNENCNVDFTPTVASFKVNNIGYNTMYDAFSAAELDKETVVYMTKDFNGNATISNGKTINLKLNGHKIDGVGMDSLTNYGEVIIEGPGIITNTVNATLTKSLVNYSIMTLKDVTVTNTTTSSIAIWNSDNGKSIMNMYETEVYRDDAISSIITNSGIMNIYSGNYHTANASTIFSINVAAAVLNQYGGVINNTNASGYSINRSLGIFNHYGGTYSSRTSGI